jgi:DNA-binding beta-propeller fold protein YncE
VPVVGGAPSAHASDPLTFDHIAGRPRHLTPEGLTLDGSGNVFVTDTNSSTTSNDDRVVKYDASGTFKDVIAGPGTAAGSVTNPADVTIAPSGDVYVVEAGNPAGGLERVSYFTSGGTYLGSWGAYGTAPGSFKNPGGIATDSTGDVYVADTGNKRVQVFDATGTHLADWTLVTGPNDVAVDNADNVWVTAGNSVLEFDTAGVQQGSFTAAGATGVTVAGGSVWVSSTGNVVREFSPSGTLLSTIGAGQLSGPQAVAVRANKLYVADTGNGRIVRFGLPGAASSWNEANVTAVSVNGGTVTTADGSNVRQYDTAGTPGSSWASSGAFGATVDGSGNVWVSSTTGNVVNEYDSGGNFLQAVGSTAPTTPISGPHGIAIGGGKLFVADTGNGRILRFDVSGAYEATVSLPGVTGIAYSAGTIYAAAGTKVYAYNATTLNAGVNWSSPGATDLTIDASGNFWVSSSSGVVREYNSAKTLIATVGSGTLSTPVGVSIAGGKLYVADSANGNVYAFSFSSLDTSWGQYPGNGVEDQPSGLATDAAGNVYVTNRADDLIQKFDALGAFVMEWGGTGSGNGKFVDPVGIAVGPSGNVYVADTGNNRIQRFSPDGTYQTQWGSTGTNAAAKQMVSPSGIAIGASGNVYVSDLGNDRISEFDADGAYLRTFGSVGGGDGQVDEPRGLAIDGAGNVWVADSKNNRIQEFSSTGAYINKWGGSGSGGISSSQQDGKFSRPYDLDFDAEGTLWVADRNNNRIQRMQPDGTFLSNLGPLAGGLDIAQFKVPGGIAVDPTGQVVVADTSNNRVQVFVDANGPDTTITHGPASVTSSQSAQFQFTANEPNATFKCTVDGGGAGPYTACSSGITVTGMAAGAHIFYVEAFDVDNNVGDPATFDWTVDLTPPTVAIDSSPPDPSATLSASFSYHSNENPSTYSCALDGSTPAGCGATFSGTVVGDGQHTFDVWAIDQAGNISTNAAEYTWNVDTTPPVVHIDSGPSGYVRSTTADFTFSSPEGSATFECKLDGVVYAACTSPASYTGLTEGAHTFWVRAKDTNGNFSNAKSQSWTIDLQTHQPDGWIGVASRFVGNNVYNLDATKQIKTIKTTAGKVASFSVKIENDGTDTDSYTLKGGGSAKGYTVSYFAGITDYTTKVLNGTYTFSVPPGSYKTITMKVKVGNSGKASWSSSLTVTSSHQPSKQDAVKGIVKRG